eukprot:765791-Rhodomonas_salina.1
MESGPARLHATVECFSDEGARDGSGWRACLRRRTAGCVADRAEDDANASTEHTQRDGEMVRWCDGAMVRWWWGEASARRRPWR